MRSVLKFATLAAIVAAVPAFAAGGQNNGPQKEEAKERRICRSLQSTGSILPPRRRCLTQAEWEEQAENARRAMDRSNGPVRQDND
ncbi:MAG TPA: hypothetical protein VGB54_14835 [Allosphingosinicella sp.]|jgi:hypothetical protein